MTPAQKRAYLSTQGTFCPFCYNDSLEKDIKFIYENEIEVATACQACKQHWIEQYALKTIKAEQVD